MSSYRTLLGVTAIIFSAAAGFLLQRFTSHAQGEAPLLIAASPVVVGLQRPEFALKDSDATLRHVSEWDGRVLVLNFWATWCPPCQEEIPVFIALQNEYGADGLQFVGIAIETPDNVRQYMEAMEFNYPVLIGEQEAIDVARAYGNDIGALPYTVIVDRNGKIVHTHKGKLTRAEAEKAISPLI